MTLVANNQTSRSSLIVRLAVKQIQSGFYEYQVSASGVLLYENSGYKSISEALMAASGRDGDFLGYEVAYSGITIGTYPSVTLIANAEFIAQAAVDTVASLQF